MRLSYSSCSLFGGCPSSWKRQKIDKEEGAPVFQYMHGADMHAKLEGFFAEVKESGWKPSSYFGMVEKVGSHLTAKHWRAVPSISEMLYAFYVEHGKWLDMQVEYELDLSADPKYAFLGYIDCVVDGPHGVVLVDFKSGSYHPELVESYRRQLGLYTFFYEYMTGRKVVGCELWYLSRGKKIKLVVDEKFKQDALAWYMGKKMDIENRLANGLEFETIKGDTCRVCPFKGKCSAWGTGVK